MNKAYVKLLESKCQDIAQLADKLKAENERLTAENAELKCEIRQMQNKINKAGGLALIKASHEFIREVLASESLNESSGSNESGLSSTPNP